jgi:hypothetical protein
LNNRWVSHSGTGDTVTVEISGDAATCKCRMLNISAQSYCIWISADHVEHWRFSRDLTV